MTRPVAPRCPDWALAPPPEKSPPPCQDDEQACLSRAVQATTGGSGGFLVAPARAVVGSPKPSRTSADSVALVMCIVGAIMTRLERCRRDLSVSETCSRDCLSIRRLTWSRLQTSGMRQGGWPPRQAHQSCHPKQVPRRRATAPSWGLVNLQMTRLAARLGALDSPDPRGESFLFPWAADDTQCPLYERSEVCTMGVRVARAPLGMLGDESVRWRHHRGGQGGRPGAATAARSEQGSVFARIIFGVGLTLRL